MPVKVVIGFVQILVRIGKFKLNGLLVAKDQTIQDCEVLYLIYFLGIVFGGVIITGGSG